MSDVRDVLGLSGGSHAPMSSPRPPATTPNPGHTTPPHRPTSAASNVPRELQQLRSEFNWGDGPSPTVGTFAAGGTIPLAPTTSITGFKAKRVKAVAWKLLPIRSSARQALTGKTPDQDDLELKHWVKIHNIPDYVFAKFNKSIKLLEYSNEEYVAYCIDPNWSREETDRLMDLAKKYDLRFIIMADRYNALSEEAAKRAKETSLPEVDPARIKLAEKLLTTKPHAGESKEEIEERILASENNIVLSENTTMAVPTVKLEPGTTTTETTDGAAAPPPLPIGDGVIIPPASATSSPPDTFPNILRSPSVPASHSHIHGVFEERTVEQLKSRFYFIQQTLTLIRNASDPELRKTNPLFTHNYDAAHELLRKAQLERLYKRQVDEVDEMARIVLEHREIANQIKKIKKTEKENRDVLRGYKPGTKGGRSSTPAAVGGAVGGIPTSGQKKSGLKRPFGAPPVLGELAVVPPNCDASVILPQRANGSMFLRSAQLNDPLNCNPKQIKHLETELTQLNIKRVKDLPVATGVVCDLWDKLRVNILTLLNLQAHLRDRETMREDLKLHTASSTGGAYRQTSLGAVGGDSSATPSSLSYTGPNAAANAQAQAQAAAQRKKQQEKRRFEGTDQAEQDEKRRKK